MEINEIIQRAKKHGNIESNYALAKKLDVRDARVNAWTKGTEHPSNEAATKLALMADLDPMEVIAEIELRTAKSEKKREFWKEFLESRSVAVSVIIGLIALLPASQNSEASVLHMKNYTQSSQNLFEKTTVYTLCEVQK